MADTMTKKIAKRFTPFAYKRTIREALYRVFDRFQESTTAASGRLAPERGRPPTGG